MNTEIKKNYVVPQMLVIECEYDGYLLQGSGEESEDDFGGVFGLNNGVSDVEHV